MKLLVDVQALQTESRRRGIGRFTWGYIKGLASVSKQMDDVEIYLLLNGAYCPLLTSEIVNEAKTFVQQENIFVWYGVPHDFVSKGRNIELQEFYEQIRQQYIRFLGVDAVLYTSMFEGYNEQAVTRVIDKESGILSFSVVHDLIPFINPVQYLNPNQDYKQWYLDRLENLKNCDGLLAISEHSRWEVLEYLNFDKDRIVNMSSCINKEDFYLVRNPTTLINGCKYILYTGATDARKNHFRLISSFSKLPKDILEEYVLVIAGTLPDDRKREFQEFANGLGLNANQVVITGTVSDERLRDLYSGCYLYIFPSLSEGFGLPVLEAMACGAAVIGSNQTSIPEVIGWKEALFDPHNENEIRDKIVKAITDHKFYNKLKKNGRKQLEKFSWEKTAVKSIQYIKQYINLASKNTSLPKCDGMSQVEQCRFMAEELASGQKNFKKLALSRKYLVNLASAIDINASATNQSRTKSIYFDITELYKSRANSGIQRVTRKILYYFATELNTGYNILPVYFDEKYRKFRITKDEEFHYNIVDGSKIYDNQAISPKKGDMYIANDLILNISPEREWVVANMKNIGVKFYFMIHDILPTQLPHFFDAHFMPLFENHLNHLSKYHDGIICISESVVFELQDWYLSLGKVVNHPIKIDYSHNGTDLLKNSQLSGLTSEESEFLDKIRNDVNFIMVGTMEPRKGHMDVIAAFEDLLSKGVVANLIIVGKYGWNISATVEMLQSSKYFNKRIFWLSGVSDSFLESLYFSSVALIAASYAEGFGLPIVEAFQRKLAVIARDIPVFREVGGEHAEYFKDKFGLVNALQNIIKKANNNEQIANLDDVKFLTWRESSENFWNIIQKNEWRYQVTQDKNHLSYSFQMREMMHIGSAGRLGKRGIESTQQHGHLIYGPYLPFNAGRYKVSIHFNRFEPSSAKVDVYSNDNIEVICEALLRDLEKTEIGDKTVVNFEFSLERTQERMEFRIWVDDLSHLTVSRVDIHWLNA